MDASDLKKAEARMDSMLEDMAEGIASLNTLEGKEKKDKLKQLYAQFETARDYYKECADIFAKLPADQQSKNKQASST
eukprot:scaffold2828_cov352-Prasinococcus_capsulatus_cf.AAC.2